LWSRNRIPNRLERSANDNAGHNLRETRARRGRCVHGQWACYAALAVTGGFNGGGLLAQDRGSVTGVVLDVDGRALESVQVWDADSGYGALSDSLGGFRVDSLPPGPTTLHVQVVGFEKQDVVVDVRGSGPPADVVVSLSPTAPYLCPVSGGGECTCGSTMHPALIVVVLDSVSGMPLGATAEVLVADGDFRARLGPHVDPATPIARSFRGPTDRVGTYSVLVEAEGYARWVVGGLEVTRGRCGVISRALTARLRPSNPAPYGRVPGWAAF
jgi:hypothetical protein